MSWFYPLQKLFGYEVGPEDKLSTDIIEEEALEAAKAVDKRRERTKDMRYLPTWERLPLRMAERKLKRAKEEMPKRQKAEVEGDMSMRDIDILISRQEDPNIREYQKKAIKEKRVEYTMFRVGVGPMGQSVDSITDYRMPKIESIQKQEGIKPNLIQAAIVKEIDKFNQTHRVPTKRSHFKGAMPDPKRILGDKYDPDKDYNWRNTKQRLTILDVPPEKAQELSLQGAYVQDFDYNIFNVPERIEWREPNTRDDKMSIAHEQLHRFIKKHPSGKAFRDLDGDHELFVRAYTHLLDGGRLDDPELMVDLESAVGKYSDINLNRFLKDVPRKIQAFERAVLGADYGEPIKRENWLEEIVVTATRPNAVEDQMEQLLKSKETRAIRNNNPFNINYSEIKWEGKLPIDIEIEDRFERFDSPLMGMRAGIINTLTHHIKYGEDTIEKLISRHAPPTENDTEGFINFVAKEMGISPNQKIDLKNKAVLHEYSKAVVTFEGFKADKLSALIDKSIALAYKQKNIT